MGLCYTLYRKPMKRLYPDFCNLSIGLVLTEKYSIGKTEDLDSKEPRKMVKVCSGPDNAESKKGYWDLQREEK